MSIVMTPEEENQKLKKILSHLLSERSGVYFICGEAGNKDALGLPDRIFICPTYGADGFAVYEKKENYTAPSY